MVVAEAFTTGSSTRAEEWLSSFAITEYELHPKLKLSTIDLASSAGNQARFEALDPDHVIVLAEAMARGRTFEPIVVKKMANGRYKVLDGNHRREAADLNDRTTIAAYVITQELSETEEHLLIATANFEHGLPNTMDERLALAAWLIEHRSISQKEAAQHAMIPERAVREHIAMRRASARVGAVLGRTAEKLTSNAKRRLDNLKSDVVMQKAGEFAIEAKLNSVAVSQLVAAINRERSESSMLAVINKAREEVQASRAATATGRVSIPRPIQNVQSIASRILALDLDVLRDVQIDNDLRKRVQLRIADARARLEEVAGVI